MAKQRNERYPSVTTSKLKKAIRAKHSKIFSLSDHNLLGMSILGVWGSDHHPRLLPRSIFRSPTASLVWAEVRVVPIPQQAFTMSSASISNLLSTGDVESLLPLLEASEMEAASLRKPHSYAAAHMLCLLVAKDLCEARFLWRRLSPETKAIPEVSVSWALARAQWSSEPSSFFAAAGTAWPVQLQPLVEKLIAQTRDAALDAVRQGYECISAKKLADMVGLKSEDVPPLCRRLGWRIDGDFILVSVAQRRRADNAKGVELQTLTEQLVHLQTSS